MKNFSNSNIEYNPYAEGSIENKLYSLVNKHLTCSEGKIAGVDKLIEGYVKYINDYSINENINMLHNVKKKNFEKSEEDIAEPSDISELINRTIKEDDINRDNIDIISTDTKNESLIENQISQFIKIIKS